MDNLWITIGNVTIRRDLIEQINNTVDNKKHRYLIEIWVGGKNNAKWEFKFDTLDKLEYEYNNIMKELNTDSL